MKKLAFLLAGLLALSMTACGQAPSTSSTSSDASVGASSLPESASASPVAIPEPTLDQKPVVLKQFEKATGPQVILKTSMGDIEIMLFPDEAPKAVENFLTHAKDGYYNGLLFHRVINDFMLQGGDPKGDSTGGESIWDAPFEDEFSDSLRNFRGALSMANSGTDTNGSQFFIMQGKTATTDNYALNAYSNQLYGQAQRRIYAKIATGATQAEVEAYAAAEQTKFDALMKTGVPADFAARMEPVIAKYTEVGGATHLDNKHTVFGQVTKGMDVVDAIAAVEVTAPGDKPKQDVTIVSITIKE